MHQNRASPFASDFRRRGGYRREFRIEDHFYPFHSQKKSRFVSGFLRRGNRASWGLKKSRDFLGSGQNRRRSRRESRDFGALRTEPNALDTSVLRRAWEQLVASMAASMERGLHLVLRAESVLAVMGARP